MNIKDLKKAFSEIFEEIEQMDEEKIKKIDFEIEKNITKYRKSLLNYNNESESMTIDTTYKDVKYVEKLKGISPLNQKEFQKHNYGINKVEGISTSAA